MSRKVYFKGGGFGNFAIQIDGLDSLMRWLKDSNPKLQKALRKGLKEAAQPVLQKARANAKRIHSESNKSRYGLPAMQDSLSIASRRGGLVYVLKSDDPAAPVKEFAHYTAKTISSKGTPRANARLAMRSGVGVPRRANQPRVMVPAVNDSVDEVKDRIDACLAEVLKEVEHG